MKNTVQIFCLITLFSAFFFPSCEKEIDGCTDSTACNYNDEATNDDNSCQIPIDEVLEIIPFESIMYGSVGETLETSVYLQNSSCNTVEILARDLSSMIANTQFCFAGTCFAAGTIISPFTLTLPSFVVANSDIDGDGADDTFKSLFSSEEPGEFEVRYRFYLENDPSTSVEITINYIIS